MIYVKFYTGLGPKIVWTISIKHFKYPMKENFQISL